MDRDISWPTLYDELRDGIGAASSTDDAVMLHEQHQK
jgi:hypothetical protein